MTRDKLNRNIELLRDLRKNRDLRAALETAAGPGAQVITGMPHAPGYRDKLGDLAAEIADISGEIQRIQMELAEQEPEITEFINSIQDGQTRTIFRLRFQRGMGWGEVATAMGGGNKANTLRQICFRYLRRNHIKKS